MANSLPAIYRLRVTRRLALLAALFSVLILPLNAVAIGGTQTICIDSWYATVCADNNGSSYTEQVSIFLGPNDFNGSLVANSSGDTVDISASSFTSPFRAPIDPIYSTEQTTEQDSPVSYASGAMCGRAILGPQSCSASGSTSRRRSPERGR